MKDDKASKKNLRKPAKGIPKSKKDSPDILKKTGTRNAKSKLRNPMALRKEAEESRTAISDVTKQKFAEDEIKRFASFPQLNPNRVLEADSSGIIVFCNAATIQSLRKLNLRDTTLFLPNDIADILDALEKEKDFQFYREVKIKDRIFGEVLCLTPQFDSIRIYANDITERRQTEEALIHSEEYFRLVTDSALDVLSIIETDGTIRYTSQSTEQVLGYKPEDLIGKNVFELVHPDDLPKAMEIFSQASG